MLSEVQLESRRNSRWPNFYAAEFILLTLHRGFVLPVINMADKTAAHGVNDVYTN